MGLVEALELALEEVCPFGRDNEEGRLARAARSSAAVLTIGSPCSRARACSAPKERWLNV